MSEVAGVDHRDSQPSSRAVVGDPAADDACADHQQVEMTLRELLESSRTVHGGNHSGPPVKLTGSVERRHGCATPALGRYVASTRDQEARLAQRSAVSNAEVGGSSPPRPTT